MAALLVTGAADMISVVIRQTLVQLETPDAMRGRVSAVNSLFIGASNQLGEFESGATAAWLGPVGSVVLGGVGTCWWRASGCGCSRRSRSETPCCRSARLSHPGLGHGSERRRTRADEGGHDAPHPRLVSARKRPWRVRAFHSDTWALRSSAVSVSRRASRCSFW
jgi:hypothetical protein